MGKGSRNRVTDHRRYGENYDRIFRPRRRKEPPDEAETRQPDDRVDRRECN